MRCSQCDREYPSKYYFIAHSVCIDCFEKMSDAEKNRVLRDAESKSHEGAAKRDVNGRPLNCPVCGHDLFWKRKTLLNTPGLTFMGVEWANKQAENLICDSCGYIYWFLKE